MAARFAGRQREKIDLLFQGATPAQGAYRASRLLLGSSQVAQLCGCPYRHVDADEPEHLSPLQAVSRHELTGYTRDMLLRDSDVFSMAHGLELRVPFLDREVLAAANAVDDRLKLRSGVSKPLLLAATRDLLPREVWDRPKRGFVFPLQLWLSEALRDEMDAAFSVPRLERVGLDPGAARAVWAGYLAGRLQWSRPWALYVLIRWAESHGAFAADPAAAESAVLEVVA